MQAPSDSCDYVVVGGGTAGSVIAVRLSEGGTARVLLLEAGVAQSPPGAALPPAWPTLVHTEVTWGDSTVRQEATGTTAVLARARVLGGGSAINALSFLRGHRSCYDAWTAH